MSAAGTLPALEPSHTTGALHARTITRRFGGVRALHDVSLTIGEGEAVGLIGPNGSGKTTLLNILSGTIPPTSGEILLDGTEITGRPTWKLAGLGIMRTFQNLRLFDELTVRENVEVCALASGSTPRSRSAAYVEALLEEMEIGHLARRDAGTLSYGDQRRVEIARALAGEPRFLLLDEPAAGLNEVESIELGVTIDRLRAQRGFGVVLIEHDLALIMRHCGHVCVLNEGEVIAQGPPDDVRRDPRVIEAYIGADDP